ncbi:3-keto-disaccharide hydrolase [Algoriphagus namhaensis]
MKKAILFSGLIVAGLYACQPKNTDEAEVETEIEIGETEVVDNSLTEDEKSEGWMLLFDGQSMDGWRAFNGEELPDSWVIEDGAMKALGTGGDIGGDIVFGPMEFEEFELEWTWKIEEGGNSGVMYHVVEDPKYKAPYETGPEYQVIDQLGFPDPLEPWQSIAADYAMYEPDFEGAVKPAGEWNVSRIVFTTEGASYWLNGKKTVEFVPYSEDWTQKRNSGKWDAFPDYAKAKTGLVALQDHGAVTWFKNIKIKKL